MFAASGKPDQPGAREAQRTLAKLLLLNARVLQELCVAFTKGPYELQMKQVNEIKGWVVNKSAKLVFL